MNIKDYPVKPVAFNKVTINDTFWKTKIKTNREITIPYAFNKCEEKGRIDNFAIAAGQIEGQHRGLFPFDDTDVYKIIEGASFSISVYPDAELEAYIDRVIDIISKAQAADGYLSTPLQCKSKGLHYRIGDARWKNIGMPGYSHELYNCGHMYEAAVAHYKATGKRTFLDVAIKNADLIDSVFGPGKLEVAPGHQIIEMGLAGLFRVTGDEKYIKLAKFFLETRGPGGTPYSQEHKPVLEQTETVGHAVRAGYMYSGMADVAALTGAKEFIDAIDILWNNVVDKKIYLTGGIGARHHGEAFGENYELPNASSYNETCAAISNVYWNHRLFLLHGESKYIDIMERTLYNGLISGVAMSGKEFFYPNALESAGQHFRSPWFGCSCCPGNIARFMPSIAGYVYANVANDLYVNLFIPGETEIHLDDVDVKIEQIHNYPWAGNITLKVFPAKNAEFNLKIRIPSWALNDPMPGDLYSYQTDNVGQIVAKVNGQECFGKIKNGYLSIDRQWQAGDSVNFDLDMKIKRVVCNPKVTTNQGRVALVRGPFVYCLEWLDVEGENVLNFLLPDQAKLTTEFNPDLLGGVQTIGGMGKAYFKDVLNNQIYSENVKFTAIPYHAWANRGTGEMSVWLANAEQFVIPKMVNTIVDRSKKSFSDNFNPNCRYLNWSPKVESDEWVQFDFDSVYLISRVKIFWYDCTDNRSCQFPMSWNVKYLHQGQWLPLENKGEYAVHTDIYNTVEFSAVETEAVRIEIKMPPFPGGIIDCQFE